MIRFLPGVHELAEEYDDFLVDLWGVVHDGERAFDGLTTALQGLAAARRRVLFVTNSSRSSELVTRLLVDRIGIERHLFEGVVSSGDVTREALVRRAPALFDLLPPSPACFHVGDPSFVPWLFEIGLAFVDDVRGADLYVATGTVRDLAALEATRTLLAPGAARGVPLVCTNPDRVIPTPAGFTHGPGAVAHAYAELGGRVFLYGKPHAPIYAAARARLDDETGSRRMVAIGDLLETDVRGARGAGIPSVLVTGTGVHAATLGPTPSAVELERLFYREGIAPDMVLARFAW